MYKKLENIKPELDHYRTHGVERGKSIGWTWEQLPLTIKLGCTTFIGAAPASGKTEFWFEILINLSCLHGWNHVIYSPETGDAKDIYSELCHKYIGKKYVLGENAMDESERAMAEYFINEHFVVIDPIDEDLTVNQFYKIVDQIERDLNIQIHTTTIDPWNELTEEFEPNDLGREDKYLSRILGYSRKNARKNKRHNCIITHVRDQAPITKDGVTYYPAPSARDLAGGQVWFRKGLLMITLWRPPAGIAENEEGYYLDNELHVRIAKSKPKGVSKNGVYKMFLNVESYQYFVKDYFGAAKYADRGTHTRIKSKEIKPVNFYEQEKTEFKF
jgi:hypothetical protein